MNPRAVDLPQAERHPARPRHGRQRAEHGLREHGRHLRHRRRLHPQPVARARRSSTASSCRTRRARTWWPASARRSPITELEKVMPAAYTQLREITTRLEKHYKDIQDFEFTIQDNTLYMLQTRNGKRTGLAAVHIAVDMVEEGILTKQEAVARGRAAVARPAPAPDLRPQGAREGARWRPRACPRRRARPPAPIVFTADDAVAWSQKGKRVVLVRMETVPDDIHGMSVAQGILTATGGMTSPRGRRRPPDGQAVRRGLRRARHRRQGQDLKVGGQDAEGRRRHLDRRHHRRGHPEGAADEPVGGAAGGGGQAEGREVGAVPEVREAARLGRRDPPPGRPGQRRRARATRRSPSPSARAASASAAPSTCSSPRTAWPSW